jgi:hypothetical protein
MKRASWSVAVLALVAFGCRGGQETPEAGAILLRADLAPGAPVPDELRLFVYDDTGILWNDVRSPPEGPLVAESATVLGTILIKPGTTVGDLRIDLHGLSSGTLIDEGTLIISPAERGQGTFDVTLSSALPSDTDGDGVPDPVDDCPTIPDPAQTGCRRDGGAGDAGPAKADAATDGPARGAGGAAGQMGQAGAGGSSGGAGGSSGGAAGHPGQAGAGGSSGGGAGGSAGGPGQAGAGGAAGHAAGGGGAGGAGKLPQGAACSSASACATGFCKDGACCDTACTDSCNSCSTGTCTEVTNAPDDPECPAPLFSCNKKGKCVVSLSSD